MSYKSVNPNTKDFVKTRKWKEFQKDDYFIGTFEDVGTHKDKFGKNIYGFKVKESNFNHPEGEMLWINNGGNFSNLMGMVSLEDEVKIIYKGMAKITKGKWMGTMTHDIDVQISSRSVDESDAL